MSQWSAVNQQIPPEVPAYQIPNALRLFPFSAHRPPPAPASASQVGTFYFRQQKRCFCFTLHQSKLFKLQFYICIHKSQNMHDNFFFTFCAKTSQENKTKGKKDLVFSPISLALFLTT